MRPLAGHCLRLSSSCLSNKSLNPRMTGTLGNMVAISSALNPFGDSLIGLKYFFLKN